jgi:hypothetical protein
MKTELHLRPAEHDAESLNKMALNFVDMSKAISGRVAGYFKCQHVIYAGIIHDAVNCLIAGRINRKIKPEVIHSEKKHILQIQAQSDPA